MPQTSLPSSHRAPTNPDRRASAFTASAAARLGVAIAAIAVLWLAVAWALAS